MKFKYNVFNMLTGLMFVFAFLSLMLSYATTIMFFPAMIFFEAGFVMLTILLIRHYIKKTAEIEQQQEAIVMGLASENEGEVYVMQDEKNDRKNRRKKRYKKLERLSPIVFSILASVFFLYLIISTLVTKI